MVDITHKSNTLREALAEAIVKVSRPETIQAIEEGKVPKGNVFSMSKAAGFLGIKKTSDLLPDCHPLPIEHAAIDYEIEGLDIRIKVRVKTIYKTGVEVEAMHGASVVALNIYDMLKPIDKGVEIHHIKLLHKKGGKSSFGTGARQDISAAIIVCSDSVSQGKKEDTSGKVIQGILNKHGISVDNPVVVPDDVSRIETTLEELSKTKHLVVLTGGTGASPRDVTPEALLPLLDKRLDGVEETMRRYGQERMPYAMLSRSVVGTRGNCLMMALPGSSKGVKECLDAVLPHLFHTFAMMKGEGH